MQSIVFAVRDQCKNSTKVSSQSNALAPNMRIRDRSLFHPGHHLCHTPFCWEERIWQAEFSWTEQIGKIQQYFVRSYTNSYFNCISLLAVPRTHLDLIMWKWFCTQSGFIANTHRSIDTEKLCLGKCVFVKDLTRVPPKTNGKPA